jgi:hypothetical protein
MVSGRLAVNGKMWLHTVAYTASGIGAMLKVDFDNECSFAANPTVW